MNDVKTIRQSIFSGSQKRAILLFYAAAPTKPRRILPESPQGFGPESGPGF